MQIPVKTKRIFGKGGKIYRKRLLKRFRSGFPVVAVFVDLSRSGAAAAGSGLRMERKVRSRREAGLPNGRRVPGFRPLPAVSVYRDNPSVSLGGIGSAAVSRFGIPGLYRYISMIYFLSLRMQDKNTVTNLWSTISAK